MSKVVFLTLDGDFEQGFTTILQIGEEGCYPAVEARGNLAPSQEIPKLYNEWRLLYRNSSLTVRGIEVDNQYTTNFSSNELIELSNKLKCAFNSWLKSDKFVCVEEIIRSNLNNNDEIRLVIKSDFIYLRLLPWHLWDLFEDYLKLEIALSLPQLDFVHSNNLVKDKVDILVIYGNAYGLNLWNDKIGWEKIPDANIITLPNPKKQQIINLLSENNIDILYFAGHTSDISSTEGIISINEIDTITLSDLRDSFRQAAKKGLQLVIFNSCDGLPLALELILIGLPQVIVMREPVPDEVADSFIKYFFTAFTNGDSLYLALRKAKCQLEELENKFPCASWLPVICQNYTAVPLTWNSLYNPSIQGLKHFYNAFKKPKTYFYNLEELTLEAQKYSSASVLTTIARMRLIQKLHEFFKESNYQKLFLKNTNLSVNDLNVAFQNLIIYIAFNIDKHNSTKYSIPMWIDFLLKLCISKIKKNKLKYLPPYGLVELLNKSDQTIPSLLQSYSLELESFRQAIETDTKFLPNIYMTGRQDVNLRKIILLVLDSKPWVEISQELNISVLKLYSFYQTNIKKYQTILFLLVQAKFQLRRNGYISQRLLAEDLGISQSTVSNFLTCKPVDFSYFTEICYKLALSWKNIADLEATLVEALAQSSTSCSTEVTNEVTTTLPPSLTVVDCLLEYPEGEVSLSSPFYIERAPIELRCYDEIKKPGSLIRIKAPQQMGKSSLLARILQEVEKTGGVTITIDFQLTEEEFFSNLNTFLRYFCASVSQEFTKNNSELQLSMLNKLDEHWHLAERIGSMRACKNYFERYLFPEIDKSLTLGLETVDRLFGYPKIYKEFFGLLRSLHEESKRRDIWKKLRLVMVHSTEAYVPLDINQSPFNIGLSIELPEFTHEQVFDLAQRHKLDWSDIEVKSLVEMIGGHPFLVRLALYKIANREISLSELLQTAPTAAGIYSNHLQYQDSILHKQP